MSLYKQAKEAFVSGNLGSSVHTINAVSAVGLVSYVLHSSVAHRLPPSPVVDYVLTVVPLLVGITLASAQPVLWLGFLLLTALLFGQRPPRSQRPLDENRRRRKIREDDSSSDDGDEAAAEGPVGEKASSARLAAQSAPEPRPPAQPYLTIYRAHMMVITVLSILAIDFPVFPREFGKTELWGTSLMDIGVGSFVFSLGIIGARPFLAPPNPVSRAQLWPNLVRSVKKSIPTLLLGLVRVAMVKGVEYPEHVTEYGVHWNFFFTIGLLPPFGYAVYGLTSHVSFGALAVLLAFAHQAALLFGLEHWTLTAERTDLISSNKEGLVSFPGYLAIYLLGLYLGLFLLPPSPAYVGRKKRPTAATRPQAEMCVPVLLGFAAVFWAWMALCRGVVGVDVSRRLANLPYVMWTAAFNTSFLLGYLLVQLAFAPPDQASPPTPANPSRPQMGLPPLLHAANQNALLVFLSANLLTGLVNVCVNTIEAGRAQAVGLLVVYSAAVYGLAWVLRGRKVL